MSPKSFFAITISLFLVHLLPPAANGEEKFNREFKTDYDFTVCLTADWKEVPTDVLKEVNKKMSELARLPQNWQYAYQLKQSDHWLAYPYILVEFHKGRKSEQLLKKEYESKNRIQAGFDDASKKASAIVSDAKLGNYSHDATNHTFEFIEAANINGIGAIESYSCVKLTENGFIQFCGCCRASDKDKFIPFFKNAIGNIHVSNESAYKPRALDEIPVLGSIKWNEVSRSGLIGGIVGAIAVILGALFKKKKSASS